MVPQKRQAKAAMPATHVVPDYLYTKPTPPTETTTPNEDKTPAASNKGANAKVSIADTTESPGHIQGYGKQQPYAKFCNDYYTSLAFPETLKPRDQFVDVQSVPEVDLFDSGLRLRGVVFGKIINVRVPGAEETKETVHREWKAACTPSMR